MKKQYVKPQFTFIADLKHLESIKKWNKSESVEKSKHMVEVVYAGNKLFINHTAYQRKK